MGGSATPGPGNDFWYSDLGSGSNSGVRVTHETALRSSVVYACVKVISGSLGALPCKLYRRLDTGDKVELPEHPLYRILHDQANDEHTAQEFRETMTAFALMRGTAFAEIMPGMRGPIDQLVPIHPDEIKAEKRVDNSGRKRMVFVVRRPGEPERTLLRSELFIYRALVTDRNGVLGIDPIMAEANAIGARLASQDYGARFFQNDAQAGLILKHPSNFKTKEDRDRFIEGWQRSSVGANRHRTRLLEFGMEPQTITMTNDQAQFLETQKYQDLDVARIFNMQPHKVGITDQMTFTNVEQQNIEHVTDTLMPWGERWKQSVKRDLILQPSIFAELNFTSLLKGDTEQRFRAYAIGRNWGWLSPNDVRRLENMNRIEDEGADDYLRPLNMVPAGDPAEPSGMNRPGAFHAPAKENGKRHEH